jgi:hypothetical protein
MSDDKDVFGKADALLRRGIKPPADGSETGGVPVLTDFVEPHPAETLPDQDQAAEPPSADAEVPFPEEEVPFEPPLDVEPHVDRDLTQEVIDRVLAEVEQRLAADLERRVLEHLTPQVHAAVASALGDLHQELANAIGDAIKEALERRTVK